MRRLETWNILSIVECSLKENMGLPFFGVYDTVDDEEGLTDYEIGVLGSQMEGFVQSYIADWGDLGARGHGIRKLIQTFRHISNPGLSFLLCLLFQKRSKEY